MRGPGESQRAFYGQAGKHCRCALMGEFPDSPGLGVPRCTALIGSSLIRLGPTSLDVPCARAHKYGDAIAAIDQTFRSGLSTVRERAFWD